MASVIWTATTGGTWSNAADWSVATGPQSGDDVTIDGSSGPLAVTYAAGSLVLDQLMTNNAELIVSGGLLSVANGTNINGGLAVSAGQLNLASAGGQSIVTGSVTLTGGTLSVLAGGVLYAGTGGNSFTQAAASTLQINRGMLTDNETFSTLAGTVTGNGALALNSTAATLASGFTFNAATLVLENGTVYLGENLAFSHAFLLDQAATLNLGSYTLNLSGLSSLNGTIANSTTNLTGTGHFNGLTLESGTVLNIRSTYTQLGAINLGTVGAGTLSIASGGTLRIAGDVGITNQDQAGEIINAGTLIKTGGASLAGDSIIYAPIFNTGTIDVAAGTLLFEGPSNGVTSTLDGTLAGAGTAEFFTGNFAVSDSAFALTVARTELTQSAGLTLTSSSLTYAGAFIQTGSSVLDVGTTGDVNGSTLTLTGQVALDGGLLQGTGTVLNSGAVNFGGNASLEGNLTFDFGNVIVSSTGTGTSISGTGTSVVSQTGNITVGNGDANDIVNVETGESWLLKGPSSSISGTHGTINNYGLFEKANGSGDSVVQNDLNNYGTLAVQTGMLTLSGNGGGALGGMQLSVLGGSVTGAGALDVTGNVSFANGLSLTVGEVILDAGQIGLQGNLSYAHDFSQAGGTLSLDGNATASGNTLTLSGVTSLEDGVIQGPGAVIVNGAATIGQGPAINPQSLALLGAQLTFNGNTLQSSTVALTGSGSVTSTLTIGSAATYTLAAGASIGNSPNSVQGMLSVHGTLLASGAGTSTLSVATIDSGMIKVSNGELNFLGSLTGTGSVNISGGGTLLLNDSSTETVSLGFGTGGGLLSLAHPTAFASVITGFASGDGIELQGFAFANITPQITTHVSNSVTTSVVTLAEAGQPTITLDFAGSVTGSLLTIGEGPNGGLTLFHT
jgi:hypothetical protein